MEEKVDLKALRRELGPPPDAKGSTSDAKESLYEVGQAVSVFHRKKKRWFDDGKVLEIGTDGRYRVQYNQGKKTNWKAPDSLRVPPHNPDVNPTNDDSMFAPPPEQSTFVPIRSGAENNSIREEKTPSKYQSQLSLLQRMGFPDNEMNIKMLKLTNGDVPGAVDLLLAAQKEIEKTVKKRERKKEENLSKPSSTSVTTAPDEKVLDMLEKLEEIGMKGGKRDKTEWKDSLSLNEGNVLDYLNKFLDRKQIKIGTLSDLILRTVHGLMVSIGFEYVAAAVTNSKNEALKSLTGTYRTKAMTPLRLLGTFVTIGPYISVYGVLVRPQRPIKFDKSIHKQADWEVQIDDTNGNPLGFQAQFLVEKILPISTHAGIAEVLHESDTIGVTKFLDPKGLSSMRQELGSLFWPKLPQRMKNFIDIHQKIERLNL